MTRLPSRTRNPTESSIIRRFSSGSTWVTFSRWSDHVFPTSVHTGANESASSRRAGSSSALESRRLVIPNAAISDVPNVSRERRSNSASSFGLDAGKPASIRWTPSESSAWATRTFSSTDSDMPSPCMPSRRVVS